MTLREIRAKWRSEAAAYCCIDTEKTSLEDVRAAVAELDKALKLTPRAKPRRPASSDPKALVRARRRDDLRRAVFGN